MVAGADQNREIFLLTLGFDAFHQIAIKEIGDIGQNDADGVGGPGPKTFGVEVGLIIGLFHHGQDFLPQLRRNGAFAIDDLGDRGSGNAQLVGNITNGGFHADQRTSFRKYKEKRR